jgi:glucose/mannose-6-phosphate isomerase
MNDMKTLVQNFPGHLQEAIQIGEKFNPAHLGAADIQHCIITGLGGSGIGGTIVSEIVAAECKVPVLVNKDYFLPSFVNEKTLVIVSSYSGNTEETLQAFDAALKAKAKIVCVTSGGLVAELAGKNNCDLVLIPPGMPPRSCLGYSLTQLFYILNKAGLIGSAFTKQLQDAIDRITSASEAIRKEAKQLAESLYRKIPVIYAVDGYNGVATRFRQQINENSKMLCWHHILPEMNHNELVGWAEKHDDCAVVILR